MDIGLHEVADRRVHQAVAGNGGNAAERLGHDGDAEMAVTLRRSGMPGVQMALILDDQERAGASAPGTGAGAVAATGPPHPWPSAAVPALDWAALVLLLSQNTWGSRKTNMAMGTPINLKWTQVATSKFRAS